MSISKYKKAFFLFLHLHLHSKSNSIISPRPPFAFQDSLAAAEQQQTVRAQQLDDELVAEELRVADGKKQLQLQVDAEKTSVAEQEDVVVKHKAEMTQAEAGPSGSVFRLTEMKDVYKTQEKKHAELVQKKTVEVEKLGEKYQVLQVKQTALNKEKVDVQEQQEEMDQALYRMRHYKSADMNPWTYKTGGYQQAPEKYDHAYGQGTMCRTFGVMC